MEREEVRRGREEEVNEWAGGRERERERAGGVTDFEISRGDYTPSDAVTMWGLGWRRWEVGLIRSTANAGPPLLPSARALGQRAPQARVGDASPDLGRADKVTELEEAQGCAGHRDDGRGRDHREDLGLGPRDGRQRRSRRDSEESPVHTVARRGSRDRRRRRATR